MHICGTRLALYLGMNRSGPGLCLCTALLLLAPLPAAGQVSAEPWFRAGTFMLTVEAGGAAFTDFDRSQARPLGSELGVGDFRRRVSARTSGSAGVWASYWILDGVGIRGGLAWVPSGFTVWNEAPASGEPGQDPSGAGARYASLNIWLASASAVLRLPLSFGRVVPYGLIGGGVIRYQASDDATLPPEARDRFEDGEWQMPTALIGVGAAIPLQRRNLLLSFELTNHLSRPPLQGRDGEVFELSGVQMQLDPDPGVRRSEEIGLTSHLRLSMGLTLPVRAW